MQNPVADSFLHTKMSKERRTAAAMFHIGICEDDYLDRIYLQSALDFILKEMRIAHQTEVFSDTEQLLQRVTAEPDSYQLLILDILMDAANSPSPDGIWYMNGMDAARQLRKQGIDIPLIFLSYSPDFAIDGYEVQALAYLQKPVHMQQLRAVLKQMLSKPVRQSVTIFDGQKKITLEEDSIVYLSKISGQVHLYTMEEDYILPLSLSEIAKLLPRRCFYRISRTDIVNLGCVENYTAHAQTVILKNNRELPVSVFRRNGFLEAMFQFFAQEC